MSTPERRPVHVAGKCYKYPYRNMPRIRSTVHPCFVLRLLGRYRHQPINFDYAPSPISSDDSLRALLSDIAITASSCVSLSWLHGTWFDFRERGLVVAWRDTKSKPGGRELEDPLVQDRLLEYMATHNTRTSSRVPPPTTTFEQQKRLASVPERRRSKRLMTKKP